MIISASRRTDLPAFYAKWFINRIQAGYCAVPNPFNHNQVTYVSLRPRDVDVIVFWTRNPGPLIPHLNQLDERGSRYYFQFTILNNPKELDQNNPPLLQSLNTFRRLADQISPERVIWRYDPIVFSNKTGMNHHMENYAKIARRLRGYTKRSVISVMDHYRKTHMRLKDLQKLGFDIVEYGGQPGERFDALMESLFTSASENGMEIVSCAEELNLGRYGIRPGKCIDDDYIKNVFGLDVTHSKDPTQRKACGCVTSRDVGMYDSCLFGCQYCYATSSFELARENHEKHDQESPSLIGWHDADPKPENLQLSMFREDFDKTL